MLSNPLASLLGEARQLCLAHPYHSVTLRAQWLNPDTTDKENVRWIFQAIPAPVLTPRVATGRVNSVRNNGPEPIKPAT